MVNKSSPLSQFIWLLTAAFCFIAIGVKAQPKPIITFQKTSHDFGNVQETGGPVSHVFEFTNTGDAPLIIAGVDVSCGCTTPSYSKDPIMPGKAGQVTLSFNPAGRPGRFSKSATIRYNGSPATALLMFNGEVYSGPKREEPIIFAQNFPYNKKTVVLDDPKFAGFVEQVVAKQKRMGKVTVAIESSSSRVPTEKYKTNNELSAARAKEAEKKFRKAFKKAGGNLDLAFFQQHILLVQGPEYAEDWKENAGIYEQYQYIKLLVE